MSGKMSPDMQAFGMSAPKLGLLDVPPHLLDDILICLPVRDIGRAACVCKHLDALLRPASEHFWYRAWLSRHPLTAEFKARSPSQIPMLCP